ncbi:hypothetical protein EZS27_040824, partial [termite gut metagenome]
QYAVGNWIKIYNQLNKQTDMKKTLSYFLYTMLIACIVCACSDDLDIIQSYGYSVETLPLPKKLKQGETVNLEFFIIRKGNYSGTSFRFRYFQSDGTGILTSKDKTIPVNRYQDIVNDDFVLTYQCTCEEQQQLDFMFEDNFGKRVEYTVTFASERTEEEK